MKKEVFDFKTYKKFLVEALGGGNKRTGQRLSLSRKIGVQTAYISQVLNGNAHLSLEQAYGACEFLNLDTDETDYFLLLVQKDRAGTHQLKTYYKEQLEKIIQKRMLIKNRLKQNNKISKEDQSRYYSRWYYLAIHMAVSVPHLQTKEALAEFLELPMTTIIEALEFLKATGLVAFENGRHQIGNTHIHLENDSDNIIKHHSNWRLQGLKKLDENVPQNLHYSVVYSVSKKDAAKIRDEIIKLIKSNLKIVEPSPEETLFCNTIDFFEV